MSAINSPSAPAKPSPSDGAQAYDGLIVAVAFFAAAVVLHNSDHVRRGAGGVDADVFWLGTAAIGLEVGLVILICQRHRVAPLAAAVTGMTLAAGYVLVHFLPDRQWVSDSLISRGRTDVWSVLAASIEVAASVALAVAGGVALSRLGGLDSAPPAPALDSWRYETLCCTQLPLPSHSARP